MQPIFWGRIADVVTLPDGLIFAYADEEVGEQTRVAFKLVSFKTGRMTNVAKNIYQSSKFGPNYKAFCALSDNYVTDRVELFPGKQMFMMGQNGSIRLLDTDASVLYSSILWHDGVPASGFALYGEHLWCCFEKQNMLIRYNLSTMREELRMGGSAQGLLDNPCDILINGDMAYVCNAGASQIVKLDLKTYALQVYRQLNEAPGRYLQADGYEFVLTKTGLYML